MIRRLIYISTVIMLLVATPKAHADLSPEAINILTLIHEQKNDELISFLRKDPNAHDHINEVITFGMPWDFLKRLAPCLNATGNYILEIYAKVIQSTIQCHQNTWQACKDALLAKQHSLSEAIAKFSELPLNERCKLILFNARDEDGNKLTDLA